MEVLTIHHTDSLSGRVRVSGSKNSALPILAACLLTDEVLELEGVPHVTDVRTMIEILQTLGVGIERQGERLIVRPNHYQGTAAPYELVSLMRASICVLGPLLARHKRARVSMPGGCSIGHRPIDLHFKGLEALGATIGVEHGDIIAQTPGLRGAVIHLAGSFGSSVLATGNIMMAAALAEGTTVIEHAACEPEVVDLANFLIAMGAKIVGHGTPLIQIEGVSALRGTRYHVIPDRIEAGTLMIAAAMIGGDVTIDGARPEHLGAVIEKLGEARVRIDSVPARAPARPEDRAAGGNGSLRVRSDRRLNAVQITTLPFPGFPTDLQAQMTALMAVSRGVSVVTEKIYPERFMHVPELRRMGADITREGASAIVKGVERLSGAPITASDLRASAALVLAGLAAENSTQLRGVEHLDRGYQQLEQKLSGLGATIRRERG